MRHLAIISCEFLKLARLPKIDGVEIRVVERDELRYPTLADYFIEDGKLKIKVLKLNNGVYERAIALHELIEDALIRLHGISEKDVYDFDIEFEKRRKAGTVDKNAEPGDADDSPYKKEHLFANNVEKMFLRECGVGFEDYDKETDKIFNETFYPEGI